MGKKRSAEKLMQDIDSGFETLTKEFKKYKKAKMDFYATQGVQIDTTAHDAHWMKVFLFGKIQEVMTGIPPETEVVEAKSAPVKSVTKKTGEKKSVQRKAARKKARTSSPRRPKKSGDDQRQLNLQR